MKGLVSVVGMDVIEEMISIAQWCPEGCFVEVGVFKGGTAQYLDDLAERQGRELYLYDTFTGIPFKNDFDTHSVGDFSHTSFAEVSFALPKAKVVKGVFPESAVPMPPVAFAHIDCDQYRSIKESVEYLQPKIVKGGIIWFDDYCLYGAKKAIEELYHPAFLTISKTNKAYVRL